MHKKWAEVCAKTRAEALQSELLSCGGTGNKESLRSVKISAGKRVAVKI